MAEIKNYVGLDVFDNWGNLSYCVPSVGKDISGIFHPQKIEFEKGQNLRIRWPDNSESLEEITFRCYSTSVSDLGRTYSVNGELPCINVNYNGLDLIVNLSEVEVMQNDLVFKEGEYL